MGRLDESPIETVLEEEKAQGGPGTPSPTQGPWIFQKIPNTSQHPSDMCRVYTSLPSTTESAAAPAQTTGPMFSPPYISLDESGPTGGLHAAWDGKICPRSIQPGLGPRTQGKCGAPRGKAEQRQPQLLQATLYGNSPVSGNVAEKSPKGLELGGRDSGA